MRLTPFEEYMFLDDRPGCPMWISVFCTLSGTVDRKRLDASLQRALLSHPLLSAKIRSGKRGRLNWDFTDSVATAVNFRIVWRNDVPPVSRDDRSASNENRVVKLDSSLLFNESLDPIAGNVFQATGREKNGKIELAFLYHHSVADAAGFMKFLKDWRRFYELSLQDVPLPPHDFEEAKRQLSKRGKTGYDFIRRARMKYARVRFPAGIRKFLFHKPWTLLPLEDGKTTIEESTQTDSVGAFPHVVYFKLSADQFDAYRLKAKKLGVSLNDLLLRDYFLAVGDWRNRRGGFPQDDGWIRISVPVNLRTEFHAETSASNTVCMVFLDQRPESLKEPLLLLRELQRLMNLVKRYDLGHSFLASLRIVRLIPGRLAKMLHPPRCMATSCLTNIGVFLQDVPRIPSRDVMRFGDAVMEDVFILPPVRPLTMCATSVLHYGNSLRIALTYDPNHLSHCDADELLQTFFCYIERSMNDASDA